MTNSPPDRPEQPHCTQEALMTQERANDTKMRARLGMWRPEKSPDVSSPWQHMQMD